MSASNLDIAEFRVQLERGVIQRAYGALISYMMTLRTHFRNNFEDGSVSALYQGYMDMSYFALFPAALRPHELKVPIVLNYRPLRFEVWLSGKNRAVRDRYWGLLKDVTWPGYRVIAPRKWADPILEHDLTSNCDLDEPTALTNVIEHDGLHPGDHWRLGTAIECDLIDCPACRLWRRSCG